MIPGFNLPHEDLLRFREAVAARLGLRFEDNRLHLLEEALAHRLRACKSTFDEYLQQRLPDIQELGEVARFLSVTETYFLRNRDQFDAFASLVADRANSGARVIRVLSAACSSGEEPYSLAMVIRETLPDLGEWDIRISAFDINPDSLEKAHAARYRMWALRETPDALRRSYFREDGSDYELIKPVRSMVHFELRNLAASDPEFWRPGSFDFIFCRNALMYFAPKVMREAVNRLATSLAPGGYLFLGHAENLRGVSNDFHLRHSHGTFYYQRRKDEREVSRRASGIEESASPKPLPNDVSWFAAIARASQRIRDLTEQREPSAPSKPADQRKSSESEPRSSFDKALELWKLERFQDALSELANTEESGSDPDSLLLRAMALVSKADAAAALEVCDELLRVDELNAGAHYVMALCKEHRGDIDAAIGHDETAIYLDPQFAMPRLHLGLLARRSGNRELARRKLTAARELFAREDAARIVLFGGGFGRDQLIALCEAELRAVEAT